MRSRYKETDLFYLKERRKELQNYNVEICRYLCEVWDEQKALEMVCYEYEDFYGLAECDGEKQISDSYQRELIQNYRMLVVDETKENLENILQIYSDTNCYNKAEAVQGMLTEFEKKQENRNKPVLSFASDEGVSSENFSMNTGQLQGYMERFIGREEQYTIETLTGEGRRTVEAVPEPVTEEVIKRHFQGEITVGTIVQRSNSTAKFLVVDIDVSKKVLLSISMESEEYRGYMQRAANVVQKYMEALRKLGITGYVEESGYRGFHIWILFSEWVQTRLINLFQDIIESMAEAGDDAISVEFFPNKSRIKPGKVGQSIKLPLGYHGKTMNRSRFLSETFETIASQGQFIMDMTSFSGMVIKRIIGRFPVGEKEEVREKLKIDEDLGEYEGFSDEILVVLKKCSLMRYLCQKAKNTGYLSHFERLSLLYVFGHMGEEGQDFLHKVMSLTMNYQYRITQKFILKVPAKPISCLKLREQYSRISAEYGCDCNFFQIKNCYPSPVLHAIKSGTNVSSDITVPTSRTLTKEKEMKVCEEININKKVQGITEKILEYKKQKRALDKNISKYERELEVIFDNAGIDCIEVQYGILTRRKKPDGYEWVVEI